MVASRCARNPPFDRFVGRTREPLVARSKAAPADTAELPSLGEVFAVLSSREEIGAASQLLARLARALDPLSRATVHG